jgi:hypothetical protein
VDIAPYLERYQNGESEDLREEVSDLAERYPEDPGIRYLQGVVTEDGTDAVRIFQGLVDRHPQSEWADDALYRVYQFYVSIGLQRTADLKMAQMRNDYPDSPFLAMRTSAKPAPPRAEQQPAEASAPPIAPPAGTQSGQFALQVGAYSSRENAEKQKLFFEDQGFPVEIINRVKDSRSLFLVFVGNYLTYDDAKSRIGDIWKQYRVESFVVSR